MVPLALKFSETAGYRVVLKRAVKAGDIVLAADAYMVFPRQHPAIGAGARGGGRGGPGAGGGGDFAALISKLTGAPAMADVCEDDEAWTSIFAEVAAATEGVQFDSVRDALNDAAAATGGWSGGGTVSDSESPFACEHRDLLQLALGVLIRRERELTDGNATGGGGNSGGGGDNGGGGGGGGGFRTRVTFSDVDALVSHAHIVRALDHGRHWGPLQRTARLLRRCATRCPSLRTLCMAWNRSLGSTHATTSATAAAPADAAQVTDGTGGGSASSGPSPQPPDPAELLLRLKFNVFPVLDFATASREVGVGCFPFASFFNHSCDCPNVVFHQINGGRTIIFRATRQLPAGAEATYSYVADACVPFADRRRLLYDGFLMRLPVLPSSSTRRAVDAALSAGAAGVEEAQVRRVEAAVVRELQRAHGLVQGDPAAPRNPSLRAAEAAVAAAEVSPLAAQLGPRHRLRLDLALARLQLAAARRDDATVVLASFRVLDHLLHCDAHGDAAAGGIRAAGLYLQNAMAVQRLLDRAAAAPAVPDLALQRHERALARADWVLQGFGRAARLLQVCLGPEHPYPQAATRLLQRARHSYARR